VNIRLRLFATLQDYGPESQLLEVADGAVLGDVVERLGLPDGIPLIMIRNGRHADRNDRLEGGDEIALFPPIAGG
jgi:molybdopterin converting factor small subunit